MKIAFVIHHINDWGGQERSTLEFINRCARQNEVHLYAYSATGVPSNVVIHRVPLLVARPFFLKDFIFRIAVKIMMRAESFDVINATGNCCFDSNVVTIQFCQKRWAVERKRMKTPRSWQTPLRWFQSAYDVFWEKLVYGRLKDKWYIALSDSVAQDLKTFFGVANVAIIPHGVDAKEFQPSPYIREKTRRELGVAEGETLLLFVGTFERKGLFFLLPAFAHIAEQTNMKLCVVGDGPVERARARASELGIADRLIFAGFTKEVTKYYQAADCFILPSLYDPFGLVGIEALASGLPSILSIQSGSSSLIKPGENGYVIEHPDDEREIARALDALVSDKNRLEKMKSAARISAENQTWDKVWRQYDEVFQKAAEAER